MTLLVPHISEDEIGVVPQYLRDHRKDGRAFTGPLCPGSHLPYEVAVKAVAS